MQTFFFFQFTFYFHENYLLCDIETSTVVHESGDEEYFSMALRKILLGDMLSVPIYFFSSLPFFSMSSSWVTTKVFSQKNYRFGSLKSFFVDEMYSATSIGRNGVHLFSIIQHIFLHVRKQRSTLAEKHNKTVTSSRQEWSSKFRT